MKQMTDDQAYIAMFYFLKQFYKRGPSDEIGNLLSFMSLVDGRPADPAFAQDWKEAVEYAINGGKI